MNKIINKPWDYSLFESEGDYLISVLCGTVGLYQLKIWLNEAEKKKFGERGIHYADELSKAIKSSPSSFKHRNENVPT